MTSPAAEKQAVLVRVLGLIVELKADGLTEVTGQTAKLDRDLPAALVITFGMDRDRTFRNLPTWVVVTENCS